VEADGRPPAPDVVAHVDNRGDLAVRPAERRRVQLQMTASGICLAEVLEPAIQQ
jgi:hypothetical protein